MRKSQKTFFLNDSKNLFENLFGVEYLIKSGKLILILHKKNKNNIKIEIFYEKLENAPQKSNFEKMTVKTWLKI